MDKDKFIQALTNLPEEWFSNAYLVRIEKGNRITIQMDYDADLVKELINANRWKHEINSNGFMQFIRDDGLEITMT